ncbi:PolC-type DNA polymerase III [Peptostreptococcus anaerobius]|uniref:PolC-type DNA polymerase III n=1 Tax=Peptostreptococcus anaerobius TaxID=1261 RepID=UPI00232A8A38|nr:PolC-type DNA polymerase III [Peptostreptococcus anaerobius]MDB8821775.1 PolC-type DNA polymerase III [Peptostreptococcus anaerobius]MDB8826404.1 PolC-type DNA polymerase III [Peptostreptococcus anaerobius]MDB8828296.1 PolC-type DNA polymerase III [Peptostreptococcus anaerobius]MDB8830042.1 PolC-type DNA polymerase III [Peptostreptococcus anaerobius]MDB8831881.1 PolC-type DNA polymerase III [Peptostreptococcus anaerobius]
MERLVDFLRHIGFANEKLLVGLDEVEIENCIYNKDTKIAKFVLISKEVLPVNRIDKVRSGLEKLLKKQYIRSVEFSFKYIGLNKKGNKDMIKKLWPNIFDEVRKASPFVYIYGKDIEHIYIDDRLKIKAPDEFIYESFKEKNLADRIRCLIREQTGIDIRVEIELAKKNENEKNDYESILEKIDAKTDKIISRMDFSPSQSQDKDEKEETYKINFEEKANPDQIYGRPIIANLYLTSEIEEGLRTVAIKGRVIEAEDQELRNGKTLYMMNVSDGNGALMCKVFLDDMNKDDVIKATKKGTYIKVQGDLINNYKTFDLELNVTAIEKAQAPRVEDTAEVKRVELHAHTQMSSMDGMVPVGELVSRAASWGHKAIAITDHGVVQAFPDAMNAGKKNGIKIIYGVEAYLVDDDTDTIVNANDRDLDQTFVVFDIETTGLSPHSDNLTEIGAVKVQNCEIVDSFSTFVNPKMDISYQIQELTRITNEMVKDAPSLEEALPKFLEFAKDSVLVAHNADFDTGFIYQKCQQLGLEYNFEKVDTLTLARIINTNLKRFSLDKVCKEMGVVLSGHHRAVNDAQATAEVFIKYLEIFKKKGINKLSDVNRVYGKVDYEKLRPSHATIYAQNQTGLKHLYQLITDSHIEHLYGNPRILKSLLLEKREGLIVGSACSSGELYNAVVRHKSEKEIEKILELYDFIEIMPLENNMYLVESGELKSVEELKEINKKLVKLGEQYDKPVVATGDVHMLDANDAIYRTIIKYSQGYGRKSKSERLHFRTTDEMLEEFSYLGKDKAYEVVVTNSNLIADIFEDIKPIPDETYPPRIEGSDKELRSMCYEKARRIYGEPLPDIVVKRLERELNSIIGNGYAVMYIIANKLVAKSLSDGYLVGSRGSVGSSFAATMSDITEVNPLPAHYVCPNPDCKHSEFFAIGEWGSGVDLPSKKCPDCGTQMIKDGHDIPFEVFLGFEGDKEPDIDLNFSGTYQPTIHKYTEELFGEGYTFRAGTIGTVKDKTAYGYVKKYSEEQFLDMTAAEMDWLSKGCTGVKRTSGQHPGGVMVVPDYKDIHDFTPVQYPANDKECGVKTTHFDYHSISGRILKLDILGHDGPTIIRMLEDMTGIKITDIPLDDPETMSLFTSTKALGVTEEDIGTPVGSLAIPEFGTKFTRQMLIDTKPTTFAALVRISGLSHGTDVWVNNAQDLVRANVIGIKDVISTRDDIMNYLIFKGLRPKLAFTIMENVRKGRGLKPEFIEEMKANNVPDWYIGSCQKIKYMFPKAHAVAYVMTSFRIAYCKVNYPEAFYATYFTTKVEDFDVDLVTRGLDAVRAKMERIRELGNSATAKENNQYTILEVVVEMLCRGIEMEKVDIYRSHPTDFQLDGDKKILPPMVALQGMGENAALSIARERENGAFLSKEDLIKRTKVSKTVVEKLSEHGSLDGMSDKNQLSFF